MIIDVAAIHAAAKRLDGHVRKTPMLATTQLKDGLGHAYELMLKLELLQVTGSFKARGATNRLLALDPADVARGIVTASGGNHGLATARAGEMAGVPATIFLPTNVTPSKIDKLKQWGAQVRIHGSEWRESNEAALAFHRDTGAAYFHPFADPDVVAGQGTVGLEILEQMPEVTTVIVVMGGGGLISGVATAIKSLKPSVKVIGVEAEGAPVLLRAIEAGQNIALDAVTTNVATMACGKTDDRIFATVRELVDEIVLVSDAEMARAAHWLWFELGLAADLSGAAGIAALREGRIRPAAGERVCTIICGAGPEGIADAS